jgi:pimeloyl-ACP methyl ester carboxylesterase
MKAIQAAERGGYEELRLVDLPPPQPQPGQALVRVTSAGVTPLDHTVLALDHTVLVPSRNLAALPSEIADEIAAGLPVAYLSAFLALRQAGFRAGQSVLAPGVGGSVGNATLKVARALGASQLLSTAGSSAKESAAAGDGGLRQVDIVNLERESLTDGLARLAPGGVDVVVDALGGPLTGQAGATPPDRRPAVRQGDPQYRTQPRRDQMMNAQPNIVLVHGAWAEGSSWNGVIERLQADGYHVIAPQFPLTTLADDVARLRQVLDLQDGPVIVAGHSYGGQVMTALGTEARNVAGLVYIAAFGLDQGESLGALLAQGPVTPALAHLFTDQQGFGWLSEEDFVQHFAADVDPVQAKVMYAVQQPLAMAAFADVMGVPAWKSLPSWYLVATDDQALPPAAERQFAARMGATTVEVRSSHVAMVSHPGDVAQLIETAAEAVLATS